MRVLLVNSNRFRHPEPVIPFGLCCVASALEAAGHTVEVLDLCFSKRPAADIHQAVAVFQPEALGISIRNIDNGVGCNTIFLLEQVKNEVVLPCRRAFSGPIIVGGSAVGISAPEILDYLDLEWAIRGDGEIAMPAWLEHLATGSDPGGIPGLVRRINGTIRADPVPARVPDLNTLSTVHLGRYLDLTPYHNLECTIQIQTKRGCPLHCVYCTYNQIEGRRYRLRDPALIADDIETLVKETVIHRIEFTDSTFNRPLDHAKDVLRALIGKHLDLKLRTMGITPGAIDTELFQLMKEAGFTEIDISVEAGSAAMLRSLGKDFTLDQVLRTAELVQSFQIPTMWFMLLGAPGETLKTLRETFDTIDRAISPRDLVVISVGIRIYKGTPIANYLLATDPLATPDQFLHPVSYQPDALDVATIKQIAAFEQLRRPNLYLYDDNQEHPFLRRLLCARREKSGEDEPIWRHLIRGYEVAERLGVRRLRRALQRRRHPRLWEQWRQSATAATTGR
ncbi:MAG: hypothetical protein AUK55_07115 [Syntrophobacteraceae bacterium CG2_30_61_12]|nr:MAG: hypothetical protein AUK55_07115 [Syntrophobacteraceae bacterium CG2_30_61_12]